MSQTLNRPSGPTISDPTHGVDVEEYLSIQDDPDDIEIVDVPEGTALVDTPGRRDEGAPPDRAFFDNLAEVLPDTIKDKIVTDLLKRVEEDKSAREKRVQQYEEGIRRTGMGNDAPGGANFEGASRVVHPMMTEACIDYASRIMKELFPPSGVVKPRILGKPTSNKAERADRVTRHMNYQVTQQIKEARAVMETTLTQVPLGGSQYIRQYWDHRLKRPRWDFAAVDRVYVPFGAADFVSAHRRTFSEVMSQIEFEQRVDSGQYIDLQLPSTGAFPDITKAESASHKVEGLEDPGENIDGEREVLEVMSYLEVTDEIVDILDGPEKAGDLCPYLISIDVTSKKMAGMYRDWEDGDEGREPIEHIFEFPFLPWRGALSIGFPQIIGGLSAAATGALRALLDSAHVNNAQGGFILQGASSSGETVQPDIGTFQTIKGSPEADDIRKVVMPFSTTPPSPVLFQLLGFVVEAAKGVVRTSLDENPTDMQGPTPVGTQMSRVEEGLVVYSACHGRAHAAFDRLLAGLYRLNRLYLPEALKLDVDGDELMVTKQDYEGPCVVQGVSDPTIYSDQQRFAQLNYIQSRMLANPGLYNAREVELAGLKLIKWPDPDKILVAPPAPHELNAVNENLAMALGQQVQVFPEQDHEAHLSVLMDFMSNPMLGGNVLIGPTYIPAALKHASQHILYLYVSRTVQVIEASAEGQKIADLLSDDPGVKANIDKLLAWASGPAIQECMPILQRVAPVLQQAMAFMKQISPPPPVDPAAAAVKAAADETSRKAAADQGNNAIAQQANAIKAAQVQADIQDSAAANATKVQTTAIDSQTALQIAEMRGGGGFTDGASLTHG